MKLQLDAHIVPVLFVTAVLECLLGGLFFCLLFLFLFSFGLALTAYSFVFHYRKKTTFLIDFGRLHHIFDHVFLRELTFLVVTRIQQCTHITLPLLQLPLKRFPHISRGEQKYYQIPTSHYRICHKNEQKRNWIFSVGFTEEVTRIPK